MANGNEKIERMLKAIATDIGSLKRDVGEIKLTQSRQFKAVAEQLDELTHSVSRLQSDQSNLASAVALAVSQLALAQSIVKRLDRLEAAVFPTKH